MNKNLLHFIIVISAILPASLLLLLSLFGAFNLMVRFEIVSILILLIFVLGILGYVGLIMLLFPVRNKEREVLNIILLICGICSCILFINFEGGTIAWKWIFTLEEPGEWFILMWPTLVSFGYLLLNIKRLTADVL